VRHRGVDRPEDRRGGEQRSDEPEAEGERATLHELADELRLLTRGRRQQAADDPGELQFGLLGAVDEAEDADDQREQRDEREEDLIGDRAREERAVVGEESPDDPPRDRQDAASAFDEPPLLVPPAGFASVAGFASTAGFDPAAGFRGASFCGSFDASFGLLSALSFCAGRLSVLYQPPPLNTIAGVAISLRGRLPQLGHFSSVASVYDWTAENVWPQWSQW
jgi:hypothetical protein